MKRVRVKDFNIRDYVTKDGRIESAHAFNFKRSYLTALPYIEDDTVDIRHSGLSERFGKWKLILRLGKNTKTFYVRNRSKMCGKFGSWPTDPDLDNLPPGFFTTMAEVEAAFEARVKELDRQLFAVGKYADMPIREYLTGQYITDRQETAVKNGKIKPLTQNTIDKMINAFPLWIDKKISEANKDWPIEFRDFWNSREHRCKETGAVITGISTETQRRYYTTINALFNMCVKKDYIEKNPIDGRIELYPRNKGKKKIRYDYLYEEAVDFIFDQAKGSPAGKLIIATMILCGARNAEVYKNYKKSFDVRERELHIPAHISKNRESRYVFIESDRYWSEVQDYINGPWEKNSGGFMFPSDRSKSGHATDGVYKPIWRQVKDYFNLPRAGRLYDSRHTFCSRFVRKSSLAVASEMLGISPETALKYYNENEKEDARVVLRELHNDATPQQQPEPAPNPIQQQQTLSDRPVVRPSNMPLEVNEFFEVFAGAREFAGEGLLYKDDWQVFLERVQTKVSKDKMGEDAKEWLEDVT